MPAAGAPNDRHRVPGATALGLLGSAFETQRALRPLGVAEDEFGLRVCRMGPHVETDTPFSGWLYRVNHRSPTVAASLREVGSNDEVLWYFANFGADINTGDELVLIAPARATPGPVQVRGGRSTRSTARGHRADDGTIVRGGRAPVPTVERSRHGGRRARPRGAPRGSPPGHLLGADAGLRRGAAQPSARRSAAAASSGRLGPTTSATRAGADAITGRAGADRINVRGGEADRVNCGPGRDRVVLSGNDAARRCEVQIRR